MILKTPLLVIALLFTALSGCIRGPAEDSGPDRPRFGTYEYGMFTPAGERAFGLLIDWHANDVRLLNGSTAPGSIYHVNVTKGPAREDFKNYWSGFLDGFSIQADSCGWPIWLNQADKLQRFGNFTPRVFPYWLLIPGAPIADNGPNALLEVSQVLELNSDSFVKVGRASYRAWPSAPNTIQGVAQSVDGFVLTGFEARLDGGLVRSVRMRDLDFGSPHEDLRLESSQVADDGPACDAPLKQTIPTSVLGPYGPQDEPTLAPSLSGAVQAAKDSPTATNYRLMRLNGEPRLVRWQFVDTKESGTGALPITWTLVFLSPNAQTTTVRCEWNSATGPAVRCMDSTPNPNSIQRADAGIPMVSDQVWEEWLSSSAIGICEYEGSVDTTQTIGVTVRDCEGDVVVQYNALDEYTIEARA